MAPINIPLLALLVTVAIFCAGVVYQAGRLSARVEALELWRLEVRDELHKIFSQLQHLERLIRGEED